MNLNQIIANDPNHRKLENVTKVYHGLCHCCRCGCGGNYFDKGTAGFKRAISKMSKPDFEPLQADELVLVKNHGCAEKSDGVQYGANFIDIPYNADNDKCYCLYFD